MMAYLVNAGLTHLPHNVWDSSTGKHLCAIEDSVVTCVASGEVIALVRNSTLYTRDGRFICYLQQLPLAYGSGESIPQLLKDLLEPGQRSKLPHPNARLVAVHELNRSRGPHWHRQPAANAMLKNLRRVSG